MDVVGKSRFFSIIARANNAVMDAFEETLIAHIVIGVRY